MFQQYKISLLRRYYRLINWNSWRKHRHFSEYRDVALGKSGADFTCRIYNEASEGQQPVILFFHGGGWMLGDLTTHHPFCQQLAEQTSCTVISVDYRLAPEHRFPTAHEDCLQAFDWASRMYGGHGRNIILAGDSAGGNLALCTALDRSASSKNISGVLAIYPITDHYNTGLSSYSERGTGHALTAGLMHNFWDTYLGNIDPGAPDVRRALPLKSEALNTLPRTMVVTAEYDPLRDEGIELVRKLESYAVATHHCHYNSQHGFACSEGLTSDHVAMMNAIKGWVKD